MDTTSNSSELQPPRRKEAAAVTPQPPDPPRARRTRIDFCRSWVYLNRKPFSFPQRPYLAAPYNCRARRMVIRASRQVEKTSLLVNTVIFWAIERPGTNIICVFPRHEQAQVFSCTRLLATILDSPQIRRVLLGRGDRPPKIMNMEFANGSRVFVRAAFHTSDAARGIPGDLLLVDEFQDISQGNLPVLEECLSHSKLRGVILTGTPKLAANHLESTFCDSTANEWLVPCAGCGADVRLDEKCLGPRGPICAGCQHPIVPATGRWVPRNPQSRWGEGYWINHLMVPWVSYPELLAKQAIYDPALFRNECLGLSTFLGDHIVTRAEVEACCTPRPMARALGDIPQRLRGQLVAGIDWSGGGRSGRSRTVLVLGAIEPPHTFVVYRLERFAAHEDPGQVAHQVAQRCREFAVRLIAADGLGNGSVYNPLLLDQLGPPLAGLYAVAYGTADQPPRHYQGRYWNWMIGRTPSIGMLMSNIKKRWIQLPQKEECGSFLDEICCEVAEYDDASRSMKYTHAENQPDDTLHALNYAATAAFYQVSARATSSAF